MCDRNDARREETRRGFRTRAPIASLSANSSSLTVQPLPSTRISFVCLVDFESLMAETVENRRYDNLQAVILLHKDKLLYRRHQTGDCRCYVRLRHRKNHFHNIREKLLLLLLLFRPLSLYPKLRQSAPQSGCPDQSRQVIGYNHVDDQHLFASTLPSPHHSVSVQL